MAVFAGKDGAVRLARSVYDASGGRIDIGPSGGPSLGQVERWRLSHRQDVVPTATFGSDFRAFDAGFEEWSADVTLLWDAAGSNVFQDEWWSCVLDDDFAGELSNEGSIELTFAVDGMTANEKKTYYGAAVLRQARVLTNRQGVVRFQTEWIGSGRLGYAEGVFADGSFGALCGYSLDDLQGYSFSGLESLAEAD